jgi:HEAT repeat protein
LGDEEVVPHLIALLQDDDYQVQLAGLNALGKVGGPLAKRALIRCAKEGDAVLEDAARAALENVVFLEDPMAFSSGI